MSEQATPFDRLGGESAVRSLVERFGHPMLRARHLPYAIGNAERDQWMACMTQALGECGVDAELVQGLRHAFQGTADWMRNRAG
ncbi:MAG TPA: hypothetical protein VIY30_14115 [Burkholderiaceae bacterium]